MSIVETEHVLVIPTTVFHELGYFQGVSQDTNRYLEALLSPEHTSYRPRSEMEEDPSFKQLIPYVIFQHIDEQGITRIFKYTRGGGQGEKRLHDKVSIGIGGHISSIDQDAEELSPYAEGMRRELEEEVVIDTPYHQRIVGLINDDETEVGQVHLGIVHLCEVEQPLVKPRETEIVDAKFEPLTRLSAQLDQMESWSRYCLEALFN